jgi:hypothetical protein
MPQRAAPDAKKRRRQSCDVDLFTGYWFYLLVAAVLAWPRLPLMAWVNYVVFQAVYAAFWPILVALELFGFRW